MTWEEKLAALKALGDTTLRMRRPGDWYVTSSGVEIGGDGFLLSAMGDGTSPEEAAENLWARLVDNLPDDRFIVLNGAGDKRKHVRWNGFMGQEVP